jgi:hypothetical protein
MFEPPKSLFTNHAFCQVGRDTFRDKSLLPIQLYRFSRDDDAFAGRIILPHCRLTCRRCACPLDASDYMRQLRCADESRSG